MIRFIHLADVHLGAVPDKGCPWSHEREEEIWETFRRVIAGIRKNPVDLLFIAGDLFHRQPLLRELKEVSYLFSTIPDTEVFLMAGNHDFMKKGSFYEDFPWPSHVHFFEKVECSCVEIKEKNVFVYGMSYHRQEIEAPVYDDWKPEPEEGFHVLLAHGGDPQHIPMDLRRIAAAGFDYIALGHIHKPHAPLRGRAIYSGALEPIDRGDTGRHGYIEGQYDGNTVKTRFVPCAVRSYEDLVLTVREDSTQYSLEEMLQKDIRTKGSSNLYRIFLRGTRAPETLLLSEKLKTMGNITEVVDETRPGYDLEALSRRYSGTLIGDYIQYFLERECGLLEEKALYHGLQALLETTVLTNNGRK